jgi:hypothetical protein
MKKMDNQFDEFTFKGDLQFFMRTGEATFKAKGYNHVDVTQAEKVKYSPMLSCTCVIKENTLQLHFESCGNFPQGVITGFIYPDGKISGKYELADNSIYTAVSANLLSDSSGYIISGIWPSDHNVFHFEAALELED